MEWFQKYEIYCDANDWNDKTKAKKLPTLLEGEVLAILLELTREGKLLCDKQGQNNCSDGAYMICVSR